jgi:hypothetical protein
LTACDSSDSSGGFGGVATSGTPRTGTFIDAPVEGIEYLTINPDVNMPSLSGLTGAGGTFEYRRGESIIFFIGAIVLGSATAKAVMTPADLVPTRLIQDRQAREDYLLNLIRLLQTLDADGVPDNGIRLLPAAITTEPVSDIDFAASIANFEGNLDLQTYIGQATNVSSLIDSATAMAHFEASVAALVEEGYLDPRLSW